MATIETPAQFWAMVDTRPGQGPKGDCHEWTGTISNGGYGAVWFNGKTQSASRIAWELSNGRTAKPGAHIRHTCDNPPCCNAAHLLDGDATDNHRDARERGRLKHWEMPDAEVLEVRRLHAAGASQRTLARSKGVSQITIHNIVTGKVRADAGGPIKPLDRSRNTRQEPGREVSPDLCEEMRAMALEGKSLIFIGKHFGFTSGEVNTILYTRKGQKRDCALAVQPSRSEGNKAALNFALAVEIRKERARGAMVKELSSRYGTTERTINRIVNGEFYADPDPKAQADTPLGAKRIPIPFESDNEVYVIMLENEGLMPTAEHKSNAGLSDSSDIPQLSLFR